MAVLSNSVLLDLLGIIVALTCIILTYIKRKQTYWERKNFQHFKPSFPFGNFPNPLARKTKHVGSHISELYREAKDKGWKHCGIYFMTSPNYLVTDLTYLKNILLKDFNQFVDRGVFYNEKDDPLSAHLFSIGGTKWRNLRRKLTPTFTSGKMKMMFKTLVDCSEVLEKVLEKMANEKEPLDIKEISSRFTTDIIGSCAFGLDCDSFNDPNSPFRVYGTKMLKRSRLQALTAIVTSSFPFLIKLFHIKLTPDDVSEFYMNIVRETIEERKKNNRTRKDFLQLLIDMKSDSDEPSGDGTVLTFNEIAAQCFVFFLAGFETSSTTMTFCLFELAQNQEIQDKVREEVRRVLEKYNGEITYDAINEMMYLGQVIDETLRKYAPLPFITRVCVEDYKVPDDDVIIEKGTRVIIPVQGIHYDEEYYPNPNVFDPERFSEENKHKIPHYSYLPFGEGNRICIGLRFGVMQSKVGLVTLLKNYRFTLNEKTQLPAKFTPTSFIPTIEGGVWLDSEKIFH